MSSPTRALRLAAVCVSLLTSAAASAETREEPSATRLVSESAEDIERGAFSEAIEKLELWADRGLVDADVSFNRGVAYLERARTSTARSGDRGRAIAGFAEAASLRPGDAEAERAIAVAQGELDELRARKRGASATESPAFGALLLGLLTENAWARLAALASLTTTLGLVVVALTRKGTLETPASPWRLTGSVLASVGALCLVVTGGASALLRHERLTRSPAVIVASSAQPLDERGRPTRGAPLLEGARVRVIETREQRALVSTGQARVWVHLGDVQLLRRAPND